MKALELETRLSPGDQAASRELDEDLHLTIRVLENRGQK